MLIEDIIPATMTSRPEEPASPFSLVERSYPFSHTVYDEYKKLYSGVTFDQDVTVTAALRRQYPNHNLTTVQASNVNLMYFAAAGKASAKLDIDTEAVRRIRGYVQGTRRGEEGSLAELIRFAKYNYNWLGEEFIVYVVQFPFFVFNYILKEPAEGESINGRSVATDLLVEAIGKWQAPSKGDHVICMYLIVAPWDLANNFVDVFDGYWQSSRDLWDQVEKASWKDVILDEKMKKSLVDITKKFFDSRDIYKELESAWRRGIIFHGQPGNGKTISPCSFVPSNRAILICAIGIKALMHTLNTREHPVPSLYVKAATQTWQIRQIFLMARRMAPCLLIFEDIETVVTPALRSYFFNEVDGLENNDGIMIIASTNHRKKHLR